MTEIEVPTEHLHEQMHEEAHHAKERWIMGVALSSALLAGFAAVTALLAGHHANEAMLEQIHASDQWSYFQAKGIKASVLETRMTVLEGLGKKASEKDSDKLAEYKKEQEEISKEAREKEQSARHHLHAHEIFARGVTLFQVAISVAAISVLVKRKRFWWLSMGFGVIGIFFFIQGILNH
jgi:hypothetical protein